MTREIKFRAWINIGNGGIGNDIYRMEYDVIGYLMQQKNVGDIIRPSELFLNGILMQYTGLKDKNGIEIYEGDLCRMAKVYMSSEDIETHCIVQVIYNDESCSFILIDNNGDDYSFSEGMDLEVIGNIYQNPELLDNK